MTENTVFRTWADMNGIVIRSMSGELSSFAKDVIREHARIRAYKDANPDPPIELLRDKVQRLTDEFWYARR